MRVQAKKSLGQNFLINPHIIDKIVTAAEITKNDTILEIGPGTGNLTKELAERAGKIIAIEKDHRLIESLKENFSSSKGYADVEIIEGDILKSDPKIYGLRPNDYKIVANIPYYITSYLLKTVFESENWRMTGPNLIILMIQKEVAQRILAKPPHTNLLAVSMQYYADTEVVGYISKNNFRPIPKVDSAIVKLKPKGTVPDSKLFDLFKMGFSEKRKQLAGTLSKKLHVDKEGILIKLKETGLRPDVRPENLSLRDWQKLAENLFS